MHFKSCLLWTHMPDLSRVLDRVTLLLLLFLAHNTVTRMIIPMVSKTTKTTHTTTRAMATVLPPDVVGDPVEPLGMVVLDSTTGQGFTKFSTPETNPVKRYQSLKGLRCTG